ncbi:MAG: MATE family efflux transporter [Oscillospiraceae bacterium]
MFDNIFCPTTLLGKTQPLGELPSGNEILRKTVAIAWPAVMESFLVSLVSMVDNVMVSVLGTYAIAAVGLSIQPKFLGFAIIFSLNVAISALVARRHGENDREGANRILKQALVLATIIIVVISVVLTVFARPLLMFCGAQPDTIEPAVEYFSIIMGFSFFQLISMVINAAQRGVGKTKIAMRTNIISNVINVFFNYLLIGGKFGFPALGVSGAAIATVIGSIAACVISFMSIISPDNYLYVGYIKCKLFDKETISSIVSLSMGTLAEQVFFRIGFLTFSIIVAKLGTTDYATHQIANNCMQVSFAFGDGFSVAAISLVGRNLGAKRSDLAKVYGLACKRLGAMFAVILCGFFMFFGKYVFMLFTPDPNIIQLGSVITKILAVMIYFQIDQVITSGCLKGAGDTKFVAIVAFISVTLVRPLASYALCYPLGYGLVGAWLGTLLDQLVRNALNTYRFRSGKWSTIEI